ncbi:MAG: ethanolamine utilization protein EutA [Candidatus Thorarchaeota archaeon]|nr:ethanolamine utilization protein EutA [Candidatus Thorarchaeota archaeon]
MRLTTQSKRITSVGVDIGTSTSHVVFSSLLLEKNPARGNEKFEITERKILHSGPIHLTPFLDANTIDFIALEALIVADYKAAGIKLEDIDTGAVIITGETAKKDNAEEIVKALAGETGKFVAATAGPNFESVLAAHGSGAVARSAATGKTVMNVDIGGGSSNIGVCVNGKVVATSATNVGGRLVATDEQGIIVRLEGTGRRVGESIGLALRIGEKLTEEMRRALAVALANALIEAAWKTPESVLAKQLMMTSPLEYPEQIDEVTFSGGVAEFIYGKETKDYHDLGIMLSEEILKLVRLLDIPITEPEHKIRATVIGAGQSSLQVSGSTTFLSAGLSYPLRNLPVLTPHIPKGRTDSIVVRKAIDIAFKRFDLQEGRESLILAFNDSVRPSYESLAAFTRGVVDALPCTIQSGRPIMMCFDSDIGNSVGNVMRRETGISNEILSIDEIQLSEGDFIDIGEPIIENVVVPVVVKTLVFNGA